MANEKRAACRIVHKVEKTGGTGMEIAQKKGKHAAQKLPKKKRDAVRKLFKNERDPVWKLPKKTRHALQELFFSVHVIHLPCAPARAYLLKNKFAESQRMTYMQLLSESVLDN